MPKRGRRRKRAPNGAGSTSFHASLGRWYARAFVPHPDTGVPVRKTWYGATEDEARQKMVDYLADLRRGDAVVRDGRELTLRAWYAEWIAGLQVRPRTRLRYQGCMAHVLPVLGDRPLSRISTASITALVRQLHRDGAPTTRGGQPLKSRGANRVRDVLRNCLAEAVRQGKLARNVAALARPVPERDVEETDILAADQVERFLALATDAPDGNLWMFVLATGVRLAEAQGLRWRDVEGDRVHIRQTVAKAGRAGWLIDAPKTARSRRTIQLPDVAVLALEREKTSQRRAAPGWEGYVFLAEKGEPRNPSTVTDRLKRAMLNAGLTPIRLHDLRHSAGSWMVALGVPIAEVSDMLGHSRNSTTLDFYVHARDQDQAVAAMNRALGHSSRAAGGPESASELRGERNNAT